MLFEEFQNHTDREVDELQVMIKQEQERNKQLQYKIDANAVTMAGMSRVGREMKSRTLELHQKIEKLLHVINNDLKIALDREKNRQVLLLQRAATVGKMLETKAHKQQEAVETLGEKYLKKVDDLQTENRLVQELRSRDAEFCESIERLYGKLQQAEEYNALLNSEASDELDGQKSEKEKRHKRDQALLSQALKQQAVLLGTRSENLQDLKLLLLEGKELDTVPDLSAASNIRHLVLDNNKISDISSLMYLDYLQHLSIQNNRLTSTDVSKMSGIRTLIMASNQLANINGLTNLDELEYLDLSDNPLTTLELSKNIYVLLLAKTKFSSLSSLGQLSLLIYLDLSSNGLMENDMSVLANCQSLQCIVLNENMLSATPVILNSALSELRLSQNMLGRVDWISWLPLLRSLDLSFNRISNVQPLALCFNLVNLNLHANNLNVVQDLICISVCTNLKNLDLSDNPIITAVDFNFWIQCLYLNVKVIHSLKKRIGITDITEHLVLTNHHPLKILHFYRSSLDFLDQFMTNSSNRFAIKNSSNIYAAYRRIFCTHENNVQQMLGPRREPLLEYITDAVEAIIPDKHNSAVSNPTQNNIGNVFERTKRLSALISIISQTRTMLNDNVYHSPITMDVAIVGTNEDFQLRMTAPAVVVLQSLWRRKLAKKRKIKFQKAIVTIQRFWKRVKNHLLDDRVLQFMGLASTIIQSVWRGYCARKLYKKVKYDHQKELAEKRQMEEWLAGVNNMENKFDSEMEKYLASDQLLHYKLHDIQRKSLPFNSASSNDGYFSSSKSDINNNEDVNTLNEIHIENEVSTQEKSHMKDFPASTTFANSIDDNFKHDIQKSKTNQIESILQLAVGMKHRRKTTGISNRDTKFSPITMILDQKKSGIQTVFKHGHILPSDGNSLGLEDHVSTKVQNGQSHHFNLPGSVLEHEFIIAPDGQHSILGVPPHISQNKSYDISNAKDNYSSVKYEWSLPHEVGSRTTYQEVIWKPPIHKDTVQKDTKIPSNLPASNLLHHRHIIPLLNSYVTGIMLKEDKRLTEKHKTH
ncbi:hypothetical protein BJ742DRAFT_300389 [Cladochytrium replicatum]|nr:hypothetical protein BJ742DRAFT_300389 [Cladochytrium replicatum]